MMEFSIGEVHTILTIHFYFRIVTQPRLPWWPQIDLLYSRSTELRSMFTDILNKVTQSYISHMPLRMIQSLTLKGKEQNKYRDRGEEIPSYRNLLLWMVKLIHADPMLLLNVSTEILIIIWAVVRYMFLPHFAESRKSWPRNTELDVRTD